MARFKLGNCRTSGMFPDGGAVTEGPIRLVNEKQEGEEEVGRKNQEEGKHSAHDGIQEDAENQRNIGQSEEAAKKGICRDHVRVKRSDRANVDGVDVWVV